MADEEGEVGEGDVELVAVTGDINERPVAFHMKFLAPMMPALRSLAVRQKYLIDRLSKMPLDCVNCPQGWW